jgi:tyrosyl-tRNA synthetase
MDSASELLSVQEQTKMETDATRYRALEHQSEIITELINVNLDSTTEIIYWTDSEPTGATGFVVRDKEVNGVSGGGIFMHENATVEEAAGIAKNMSLKFTVTDPQIGGAKSGIRFNHKDPRAQDVLRRFINFIAPSLRTNYVTAGDLNTDDRFIEKVIQDDVGQPTCQAVLATEIARRCNLPNLSNQLRDLIKTPASPYFPLIEGAVGYGVARAVQVAAEKLGFKPRVVIQGFGAVGTSLAYYLQTENLATVVAIADQDCIVWNPEGIDALKLLKTRKWIVDQAALWGNPEVKKLRSAAEKNLRPLVEAVHHEGLGVTRRGEFETDGEFLTRLLTIVEADTFCPCAVRYQITEDVVTLLSVGGYRLVVSGANTPFGVPVESGFVMTDDKNGNPVTTPSYKIAEDKRGVVLAQLQKKGIVVIPDWVANSGTAQLFHRGLSVVFPAVGDVSRLVLDACAKPIIDFLEEAFQLVQDPILWPYGCYQLAQKRLTSPRMMRPKNNPNNSKFVIPRPDMTGKTPEQKADLLVRYMAEVLPSKQALTDLLRASPEALVVYNGFENSGRIHIAQGILNTAVANNFIRNGNFTFIVFNADMFAAMNGKCGGDLAKIQVLGHYFVEVWKACGIDTGSVKVVWASDLMVKNSEAYWKTVVDVSTRMTLNRAIRCTPALGRKTDEEDKDFLENLKASMILYSACQIADTQMLGVDVITMGIDQRKINMAAIEHAQAIGKRPPIVMHYDLIPGLKQDQAKMSKSDPQNSIFIEDSREEVTQKIKKAYCPPGEGPKTNPCLAYVKGLIVPAWENIRAPATPGFTVDGVTFQTYEELETAYLAGNVHPKGLKDALTGWLNDILEPVRRHFVEDEKARELFAEVKRITNTA